MNPNTERDERVRQLEAAIFPGTGRHVPAVGERFIVTEITPDVLDFHDGRCTVVTLSLLDSQAATLQWSKKAPTTDGFYWWRMAPTDGDTFDVVRVVKGKVYDIGDSVGIAVSQYVGEWLGPITPMVTFDAATRMRDLCVEKVRELGGKWNLEAQDLRADLKNLIGVRARAKVDAANELKSELQSLTLAEGEGKR